MKKLLGSAAIVLAGALITLLPAEFWLLTWGLVGPVGFWQKALLVGFGVWLCGAVQIGFLLFGGPVTYVLICAYIESCDASALRKSFRESRSRAQLK